MTTRVLVLHHKSWHYLDRLRQRFPSIEFSVCARYADLETCLREARPQVVLTYKIGREPYPAAPLLRSAGLRWIHVGGAGIDHLGPRDPEKIDVTNSAGIHGDNMSQYAIAAILAHFQKFHIYARQQSERIWRMHESRSVGGQTIAILGFGRIGRLLAERLQVFGMRIHAVNRSGNKDARANAVWSIEQVQTAVAGADVVVVTLPRTPATRHVVDGSVFAAMKPGVFFVNLSRGGIVDEKALMTGLNDGHVAGAALDVFETEPLPPDNQLWSMPQVSITPHISADMVGWQGLAADIFAQNLHRFLSGGKLTNIIDPRRGY